MLVDTPESEVDEDIEENVDEESDTEPDFDNGDEEMEKINPSNFEVDPANRFWDGPVAWTKADS